MGTDVWIRLWVSKAYLLCCLIFLLLITWPYFYISITGKNRLFLLWHLYINFTGSILMKGFPAGSEGKDSACQCMRPEFSPWVGKIPWRRKWIPTPVLLPGEFHGQRSMVDYSPWGYKESDMTERLSTLIFIFTVECTPEGVHFHLLNPQFQFVSWWYGIDS